MRTGKSELLWRPDAEGGVVVEKRLLATEALWVKMFENERSVGELFTYHHPPFEAPRLISSSQEPPVLVFEAVEGRPLAVERYPDRLPPGGATQLVDLAGLISSYSVEQALLRRLYSERPRADVARRLRRYEDQGILPPGTCRKTAEAARSAARAWRFAHGDFLLTNIIESNRALIVVDWEFAGLHPRGFDVSLLWASLVRSPRDRRAIAAALEAQHQLEGDEGWSIVISVLVLLAREIRILRDDRPDQGPLLAAQRATLSALLGALDEGATPVEVLRAAPRTERDDLAGRRPPI